VDQREQVVVGDGLVLDERVGHRLEQLAVLAQRRLAVLVPKKKKTLSKETYD